jgi:branched-chain amino acid transport system substrate-binding protein
MLFRPFNRRTGFLCVALFGCVLLTYVSIASGTADPAMKQSSPAANVTSGSAKGTPIVIGFRNLNGAAVSVPEVNKGFMTAIQYFNSHQDGVDGHPIKVINCNVDGSAEASINCANEFVEDHVVVSVQGADPSADAALPVLHSAGIAEVSMGALSTEQELDVGHSFVFSVPPPAYNVAAIIALARVGATNVRIFQYESPASSVNTQEYLKPAAKKLKMSVGSISYPAGSPDWSSLVATAIADHANGIGVLVASESDCTSMISSARQLGYHGAIFAGTCSGFATALPKSDSTGVVTYGNLYSSGLANTPAYAAANVKLYVRQMTLAGQKSLINGLAANAFSLGMTLAGQLRQIARPGSALTAASVQKGLPSTNGIQFMGGTYNCDGSAWRGTSSCVANVLLYRQTAGGKRAVVGNGFVNLSPYKPS